MDNLNSHRNVAVAALIHMFGHGMVFWAPYYPIDGPIEFVFNPIQGFSRYNLHKIKTSVDLLDEMDNAIQSIVYLQPYFHHCGYWRN